MKKTILSLAALATIAIVAWYFLQIKGGSLRLKAFVPEESTVVINFNLGSLYKKADLKALAERPVFRKILENSGDTATEGLITSLLENPESSGINFNDQPFCFLLSGENGKPKNGGLLFGIKEREDFERLLLKTSAGKGIQKEENLSYSVVDYGPIVVWNDKTALIYGKGNTSFNLDEAKAILSGENPSISKNDLFKKAYVKGKDIHIYMDYALLSSNSSTFDINPIKMEGDMAYGVGIDFENGEIAFEYKVAIENKKDAKWLDLYSYKAGKNSLAYTANETPVAAMHVQLNTKKLNQVLMDNPNAKEGLEEIAGTLQIKPEEVLEMLDGNVSFSFSGFETITEKTNSFGVESTNTNTLPNAALFIGVENHEQFQKLLDKNMPPPENGKYTVDLFFIGKFYLVKTDAGLTITLHEPTANELVEKKSLGTGDFGEMGKFLSKYANAGYINLDLATMPASFTQYLKSEVSGFPMLETALKPLTHLEFSQEKKRGSMRLMFKNKESNSLTQVLDLIDSLFLKQQELESQIEVLPEDTNPEIMEEMRVDTTTIIAP